MIRGIKISTSIENGNGQETMKKQRQYSDFLKDGVPIWQIEQRGMTEEEADAFKNEVEMQVKWSKLADMAAANESGKGLLDKEES
jgi:hypothetical protein